MYRLLFERVLSRFDAETMHRVSFMLLRAALSLSFVRRGVRALLAPRDSVLTLRAFGRVLDSPLGLAAGFDKDAVGYEALYALGFGFIEVGTLTGEPQPGNLTPRVFRLVQDRALINRLGFNNGGSEAAVRRLASPRALPLGVNIGKTKTVPDSEAVHDYVKSAELLAPHADYLVVNVSSPNTPGLRDLQTIERLKPLLESVRSAMDRSSKDHHVPLLLKIAPDLADEDIDAIAELALTLKLDGLIATNTTIERAGLQTDAAVVSAIGAGGLSGQPLAGRSLAVLRRLRARVGDRLLLISSGGISNADDAFERILAGATLVQGYTAFVYGGPLWPSRLRRELAQLVRKRGLQNVTQAIGAGSPSIRIRVAANQQR